MHLPVTPVRVSTPADAPSLRRGPSAGVAVDAEGNTLEGLSAARRWSRRRTVATVALTPAAFAGLVALGGGWAGAGAVLWTALVVLVALAAAAVLATYVPQPGAGARLDLGCSPCAVTAAATLLAAAMFLQMAPHQPAMALTALATVGLGLVQRLNRAVATCDT